MTEPVVGAELEITVVLKVVPTDTWTENTTVSQIKSQARTAALSRLHKLWSQDDRVTTVKNPEVTGIRLVPRG